MMKKGNIPGVGLHVTLIGAKPVLPAAQVGSLLADKENFYGCWKDFLFAYAFGRINRHHLEMEIGAQFQKAISCGLTVTRADSHQHLHLLPGVLDIVIRMCRKYGVKYIRCPYCRPGRHWFSARISRIPPQVFLNILCRFTRKKIASYGFSTSDDSSGVLYSGILDRRRIECLARSLKDGLYELICHPDFADTAGHLPEKGWLHGCDRERNTLCSEGLKQRLEKEGVYIVPFLPGK